MTVDLIVRNGTLVDGTGAERRVADVAVDDGRVVAVGDVTDSAGRVIDATDLVVAPGFVDLHTHYDAQVFWDPTLSPSPLHGVTSVMAGNCGFTIAPLTDDRADADYLMQMLARVEGMPLESLATGLPWDWRSTAEFLDRVDAGVAPNIGFLVGHSALRRAVMHDDTARPATPAELDAMEELLRGGLRAGGLGLSSTWAPSHNDHLGNPVPSRHASAEELLALCAVVGEFPGTTLEFIPGAPPFSDEQWELVAAMSRTANRPLNWNVLPVYDDDDNRQLVEAQLAGARRAAELGGRVVGLTLPDSLRNRVNFKTGFLLDVLPGWDRLMALPDREKLALLADAAGRAEMERLASTATGLVRTLADWPGYIVLETFSPETKPFEGMAIGEIAARTGASPWDTLADIVVADELRTVIVSADRGDDTATWKRRAEVWRDPTILVGASDAGAHLDMIDTFGYPTTLLSKAVREHGVVSLEEAVHLLTGAPAAFYGLRDRGTLRPGAWADLVVFDPATVGPGPIGTRFDLPGGAPRVYGEAVGVERVLVAGVDIVVDGELTRATPGRVLRSGADTVTVPAS